MNTAVGAAEQAGVPRPGEVLAGKFRVEQVLGVGGMGVVVAAHHLHLDQRVALKFLLPQVANQPTIIQRFAQEARAAARIQSEHVARVLDVGTMDDGAPYLVMEFLSGNDLAAEIKTRGPLPIATAVDYVLQACEALAEAHATGIVHRDLKPANLFLTRRPDGRAVIKVLDFGISKQRLLAGVDQSQVQGLTQTMAQLGSPAYMPPEQLKSAKDVDERADLWGLGMIVHELLTGRVAFSAATLPELHVSILTEPPQPLRAGRPDAPPELEAIVARCLVKNPAGRPQNVAELARALAPFGSSEALASAERIARILGTPSPRASGSVAGTASAATAPAPVGVAPTLADHPQGAPIQQTPIQAPMQAMAPQPVFSGYHHPAHPPMGTTYGQGTTYGHAPPRERTNTALIVMIILLSVVLLTMGSCVMCVCLGAAADTPAQR